ncbi:MAG: hypothetical protein KatS3mg111_2745 [Pirellulaceae bacterium]|nr:MAG: hypothetical protein KatS3mg111_2745 [Pirellulaceae bacterium]
MVWLYTGSWRVDRSVWDAALGAAAESVTQNYMRDLLEKGAYVDPTPIFPTVNEIINGGIEGKSVGEIGEGIVVGMVPIPGIPAGKLARNAAKYGDEAAEAGKRLVDNAPKSVAGVFDDSANFAQKTFRETFSEGGKFAGKTIDDVADALRRGDLSPADVPLEYFTTKEGQVLILNTRSAEALRRAGIPRDDWHGVDISGNIEALRRLAGQLRRNRLGHQGFPNPRSSGGGQ